MKPGAICALAVICFMMACSAFPADAQRRREGVLYSSGDSGISFSPSRERPSYGYGPSSWPFEDCSDVLGSACLISWVLVLADLEAINPGQPVSVANASVTIISHQPVSCAEGEGLSVIYETGRPSENPVYRIAYSSVCGLQWIENIRFDERYLPVGRRYFIPSSE